MSIIVDIYRIYPYIPFFPVESKKLKNFSKEDFFEFSLLSANVRAKNKSYSKLLSLIDKNSPDIIFLIEANQDWNEATAELQEKYPFHILVPQENTYGILFYSKIPIEKFEVKYLVDKKVPSLDLYLMSRSGEQLRLICLHPRPPRPKEGYSTERDGELMKTASSIKSNENLIVVGDLNDIAWSHTTRLFLRLSQLLDPRKGRGFFNTFPAKAPLLGFPLDHIFHSKSIFIKDFRSGKNIGSDHLPFLSSFILCPQHSGLQNSSKEPSKSDLREKEEIIEKANQWEGPNENVHWAE